MKAKKGETYEETLARYEVKKDRAVERWYAMLEVAAKILCGEIRGEREEETDLIKYYAVGERANLVGELARKLGKMKVEDRREVQRIVMEGMARFAV